MSKGMPDGGTIRKTIRAAVRTLERRYDGTPLKNGRSSVEQLVYCIAARQNPERRAAGAIRDLKQAFAGWNEVRVSSVLEIADVLKQHDIVQPIQKSEQIIRALARTFSDSHKLKLDELTRERAEEIRLYMTRKLSLPSPVIADFLFSALSYPRIPVDDAVGRVMQRLGLVPAKAEYPRLEKLASEGLTAKEAARFYRVIEAFSAETCTEANPACSRCPLLAMCPEGQARLKAAKEAAEAAIRAEKEEIAAAKAEKERLRIEKEKARAAAKAAILAAKEKARKEKEAKLKAAKKAAAAKKAKPAARKAARPAARHMKRPHPKGRRRR